MKKFSLVLLLSGAFILPFCTASKKAASGNVRKVTYMADVQPIVTTSCAPCHFPPKGNKKPYDTYAAVKGDIDSILVRINKNPTDKGFMPMRHPKLSDSLLHVFVQWKADGLLEQ